MTAYRLDRTRKLHKDLERIADEEEAELEQLAQDLKLVSESQEAEVRIRTKGLNLIEREDVDEARKYVVDLLKKTGKVAQEKKKKRKQQIKFATTIIGVAAAVLSVGYGVSNISSVREWYDRPAEARISSVGGWYGRPVDARQRELRKKDVGAKLTDHLRDVADTNCDQAVTIEEFHSVYMEATGRDLSDRILDSRMPVYIYRPVQVSLSNDDTRPIEISEVWHSGFYNVFLPLHIAEQLLQTKGNRSCSIPVE